MRTTIVCAILLSFIGCQRVEIPISIPTQPDPIEPACNYDPIEYSVGFKITEATSTSLYITDSLGNPQGYVIVCGGELRWMPLQ